MAREQVIKGLECCNMPNNHDDCPYNGAAHYNICTHQLLTDALALIREQQEEIQRLCDALKPEPPKEEEDEIHSGV